MRGASSPPGKKEPLQTKGREAGNEKNGSTHLPTWKKREKKVAEIKRGNFVPLDRPLKKKKEGKTGFGEKRKGLRYFGWGAEENSRCSRIEREGQTEEFP